MGQEGNRRTAVSASLMRPSEDPYIRPTFETLRDFVLEKPSTP